MNRDTKDKFQLAMTSTATLGMVLGVVMASVGNASGGFACTLVVTVSLFALLCSCM